MSIIRITEHVEGVEDYFEHGTKKGRSQHRNELDLRVAIYGDIEVLSAANRYVQKYKDWKYNYWHITISPSWIDNDMRSYELRDIVIKTLDYYFHLYSRERLAAYAEIHYPKFQSAIDPVTQEIKQRLPHVHLIVSKLDLWGINQVRILPYKKEVASAFQLFINQQYPASKGTQYSAAAHHALQIVKDYQDWNRQSNKVDLHTIPYAPHMLIQSPIWQHYTKPDEVSKKIFKRLNAALPEQARPNKAHFNALQGFQQWLNDVSIWYAEYQMQVLLNSRASMSAILSAAEDKFGLVQADYKVVINSSKQEEMAFDIRTGKKYSAIYFAYNILHLSMNEAIKWLKQLDAGFDQAFSDQQNKVTSEKEAEEDIKTQLS